MKNKKRKRKNKQKKKDKRIIMGVILSDKPKEIIRILKKQDNKVIKVTKEIIYAFPNSMFRSNPGFIEFIEKHPERMLINRYHIFEEIKEFEEL
ncbi:hypothetical protein LCGC14_2847240 [marine sediment metagenome]|uniref:Uncharacterized protein n=1 Tax=marine sediment metagenome TaxID=412755 RepID=A0A0F8Y9I7_9ZZZZ